MPYGVRISVTDMAALKVRIRGSHRPDPPDFFYQTLPPEGSALLATLATIPKADENLTLSISGDDSWRGGWPFTTALPEIAAGPVVVYQLQPDCRYVAVAVRADGLFIEVKVEHFVENGRSEEIEAAMADPDQVKRARAFEVNP